MDATLEVSNLVKKYGTKPALENVSFAVKEGSCFGLLALTELVSQQR
ncbi:hypothetical protein RCG23_01640 [Neobacillus sp. PS3-34]|nr:hypothetical protein [Neobacillus sp. PS3-34]WML48859.1 hypothetical protein RCG23_01640 [Neobacillus sp. PS3-34]